MGRRLLPVALVLVAAAADGAGSHGLAFYALLAAVPAAAVACLSAFGEVLDGHGDVLGAVHDCAVLALTVVGAADRAPALTLGTVPPLARAALIACLGLFSLQAVVALAAEIRPRGVRADLS